MQLTCKVVKDIVSDKEASGLHPSGTGGYKSSRTIPFDGTSLVQAFLGVRVGDLLSVLFLLC